MMAMVMYKLGLPKRGRTRPLLDEDEDDDDDDEYYYYYEYVS
jgi:hypothetical protein